MIFGVAGAGFSGAVVARELAESGHDVVVFEARDHVAGNCYTSRDPDTQIMVHKYGPHIFHTNNERVWDYVNKFGSWIPFDHRVKTTVNNRVYSLPVNLHSINQLFNSRLSPLEARKLIQTLADRSIGSPANFEEQALKFMGRRLYETFFLEYTRKQWGLEPRELPASILKRLPMRFDYNDSYFDHPHQAIPEAGYTEVVSSMLSHPRIELRLSEVFTPNMRAHFDHCVWTGPLDAWFEYVNGMLSYRTLDFKEFRGFGDHLGCAVMNFGDRDVPYTRISEHKHFAPWENHDKTIYFQEYSRPASVHDIPYYPVRLATDKGLLTEYLASARLETEVTFVGRLATYRYLDMDMAIGEALLAAESILRSIESGDPPRPFCVDV